MVHKTRIEPGAVIEPQELLGVSAENVRIPDSTSPPSVPTFRWLSCLQLASALYRAAPRGTGGGIDSGGRSIPLDH